MRAAFSIFWVGNHTCIKPKNTMRLIGNFITQTLASFQTRKPKVRTKTEMIVDQWIWIGSIPRNPIFGAPAHNPTLEERDETELETNPDIILIMPTLPTVSTLTKTTTPNENQKESGT
jgi:hypothetical protein